MEYEINNFRDLEIANGDPVVVYNTRTSEATCLGTGFTSFEDVRYEIECKFDVRDGDSFDVFGIDARIDFSEKAETLNTVTN
jgi:hypothetical protein